MKLFHTVLLIIPWKSPNFPIYLLVNGFSVKDENSLYDIVNVCSKIIRGKQRDLCSLWEEKVVQKAKKKKKISQSNHVLSS